MKMIIVSPPSCQWILKTSPVYAGFSDIEMNRFMKPIKNEWETKDGGTIVPPADYFFSETAFGRGEC